MKKEDFAAAWQYFRGRHYEAVFEASTISLLAYTGKQWEIVANYPFMNMQTY